MDQAFSWYGEHSPYAFPPKSLFVVLLLLAAVCVPGLLFWLPEGYAESSGAAPLIAMTVAALSTCLVVDVLLTYRRYKAWAKQRLCGDCKKVYLPELPCDSAPTVS